MRDYLKGYRSRTQRRRAANRRKRTSKYINMSDSYSARSRYNPRNIRRARLKLLGQVSVVVLCVALVVGAVLAVTSKRKLSKEDEATDILASSGSVVSMAVTEEAVSPQEDEEGQPSSVSSDSVQAAPTAVPGGVSEVIAAVGSLSADAFSTPVPTPRPKAVALTFDDGPSTENTPRILELLKKYNAHATFFVVGERVEAGADLLKQELELGCEIANHSWNHADLSKLSMKKVNKQYNKTAKAIEKATGGYKVTLLRPPYGAISDKMRKKFKHPMIIWSVDTLDWKYLNGKKEFKVVKKEVSDGDIILMHDIHAKSADGVEKILPWLIEQGYDILTVSELMERKGIKMKNGTVYASGK